MGLVVVFLHLCVCIFLNTSLFLFLLSIKIELPVGCWRVRWSSNCYLIPHNASLLRTQLIAYKWNRNVAFCKSSFTQLKALYCKCKPYIKFLFEQPHHESAAAEDYPHLDMWRAEEAISEGSWIRDINLSSLVKIDFIIWIYTVLVEKYLSR